MTLGSLGTTMWLCLLFCAPQFTSSPSLFSTQNGNCIRSTVCTEPPPKRAPRFGWLTRTVCIPPYLPIDVCLIPMIFIDVLLKILTDLSMIFSIIYPNRGHGPLATTEKWVVQTQTQSHRARCSEPFRSRKQWTLKWGFPKSWGYP